MTETVNYIGTMRASKGGGPIEQYAISNLLGDFATVPLTDYSAISTIVGWSAFGTKNIFYKKIGKLVFVVYHIDGTSNSISVSFTLPYQSAGFYHQTIIPAQDNGVWGAGLCSLGPNSQTVNFSPTPGGANWTASGGKCIRGQFFYEATT